MKIKKIHNQGNHLILDGYDCDSKKLADFKLIQKFLNELPEKIGMKKLTPPPHLIDYKDTVKEERGITGFVLIAESHISIHTYPHKNFLSFDLFSCKEFDVDLIIEKLIKTLGIKKFDHKIVKRSSKFNYPPPAKINKKQ